MLVHPDTDPNLLSFDGFHAPKPSVKQLPLPAGLPLASSIAQPPARPRSNSVIIARSPNIAYQIPVVDHDDQRAGLVRSLTVDSGYASEDSDAYHGNVKVVPTGRSRPRAAPRTRVLRGEKLTATHTCILRRRPQHRCRLPILKSRGMAHSQQRDCRLRGLSSTVSRVWACKAGRSCA